MDEKRVQHGAQLEGKRQRLPTPPPSVDRNSRALLAPASTVFGEPGSVCTDRGRSAKRSQSSRLGGGRQADGKNQDAAEIGPASGSIQLSECHSPSDARAIRRASYGQLGGRV